MVILARAFAELTHTYSPYIRIRHIRKSMAFPSLPFSYLATIDWIGIEIDEHVVDADEQLWRYDLITTIDNMHYIGAPDIHDNLFHLLEEPRRKPHYTLDFTTTVTSGERDLPTSPLGSVIDALCNRCLRTLLKAGASANYNRIFGGVPGRRPLAYLMLSFGHDNNCTTWKRPWLETEAVRDMVNELLIHGADINAGSETSDDHYAFPALTIAVHYGSPAILTQALLVKGVQITQTVWHWAVDFDFRSPRHWVSFDIRGPSSLRVLLEHADKCKHVIPLHALFERVARSGPGVGRCDGYIEMLQAILCRGYIPDKNSKYACDLFHRALRENSHEADKVGSMMLDQSPMMFQACRVSLEYATMSPQFHRLTTTAPLLQNQCKGVIISTIGHGYLDEVKQLPLPHVIIEELATVKDRT